jgi:hypothetical protein
LETTNPYYTAYPILFQDIANNLSFDIVVYLIGGENLRIKGIRNKTKDCDLLVTDNSSLDVLVEASKNLGYTSGNDESKSSDVGLQVEPSVFLNHPIRPRLEIFTITILRKLYISDTMRERAKYEEFHGRHKLRLGILQDEDVFLLKCVTARENDLQDMNAILKTRNFNWDTLWDEIEKQDKDTGKVIFLNILDNIDYLLSQGSLQIPFHKKLLIKTIDQIACGIIRNKRMYKHELISALIQNGDLSEKILNTRINYLVRIRFIKERKTRDGRTLLLPTKRNVLRYASTDTFYDQEHFIDYSSLIKKIEKLSLKLKLSERHLRIGKEIAHIISCDPLFISNRITNLSPAIVYTVIKIYGLHVTRKTISMAAGTSEPSTTGLYHKIIISLRKHFDR